MLIKVFIWVSKFFKVNRSLIVSLTVKYCFRLLEKEYSKLHAVYSGVTLRNSKAHSNFLDTVFPIIFNIVDSLEHDMDIFKAMNLINDRKGSLTNIGANTIMKSGKVTDIVLSLKSGKDKFSYKYNLKTKRISPIIKR